MEMAELFTFPTPLWTPDELVAATSGTWVRKPDPSWLPAGITYMRRLQFLKPGDIFVAMDMATRRRVELRKPLQLNEWDTAEELPTFIAAGISAVIAQRDVPPMGLPLLRVANSGLAVLDLARAARRRFTGKAIAVTGTVGKSTTKEMLRHVLGRQGPTYATMANYNSYFGVPLCLAQTPRETRFAIYENAITSLYREPGPITTMVQPHVAIFTAIGRGLEPKVESLEAIADLKSRMFKGLLPGGTAILNREMPLFERVRDHALAYGAGRVVTFGEDPGADVRLLEAELASEWSTVVASVHGERITYEVPLPGRPMILNSLATLAAADAVGADWRRAARDLTSYETNEGKLKRLRVPIGGSDFELIDDSFSAEQASMIANFEVLSLARPRSGGRRIAVLGEIGGLTNPEETHAELSGPLIASGVDKVFTYGDGLLSLRRKLPERLLGLHSADPHMLAGAVLEEVRPGDVVSAKGCSITSAFERVMQDLRYGRPSAPVAIDTDRTLPMGEGPVLAARHKIDIAFLGDTYFGEHYQERRAKTRTAQLPRPAWIRLQSEARARLPRPQRLRDRQSRNAAHRRAPVTPARQQAHLSLRSSTDAARTEARQRRRAGARQRSRHGLRRRRPGRDAGSGQLRRPPYARRGHGRAERRAPAAHRRQDPRQGGPHQRAGGVPVRAAVRYRSGSMPTHRDPAFPRRPALCSTGSPSSSTAIRKDSSSSSRIGGRAIPGCRTNRPRLPSG